MKIEALGQLWCYVQGKQVHVRTNRQLCQLYGQYQGQYH